MPADVVLLRSSRFPTIFFLIAFPLCLTGAAAHVMDAGSLLAAFDLPWVITIPEFAFITALSITNDRLPPRLSTGGIRARGTRLFRYDLDVRWDQIERIWVSRQAMDTVLVRLRDPESIAGADARLRRTMRRRRLRFSGDLAIPLFLVKPGKAAIGAAVERLSGGTHRLEHQGIDPVPDADDVVLENRFAMPAGIILILAMSAPWLVVMDRAIGLWPIEGRDLLVAVAWALLATLLLVPPLVATFVPRIAPPILAPSGLRLRTARLFSYDTFVPWEQVTGIRTGRSGPFPRLLVSVRDPEALAGTDRRLAGRLRRNRARHGADLIISTSGTNRDDAYLARAIAHLSRGTRHLEPRIDDVTAGA
ncbi:hypothetical protein [Catenuloplanes japonicus]|uniref:hypothetical protein n=1 Tax=Catenuloplanes japonicus TaxID=33876 RepID=UPI000525A935|nr:hypothetical protein [Catenuloplanes japonicus]